MALSTLSIQEHAQVELALLEESDAEFAAGKSLKGSEMLWGTAAHAMIAVALEQSRPYDSHGALKNLAKLLRTATGQPYWLTEFSIGERFHSNFYHGQESDIWTARYRPRVRTFVTRLLTVAGEPV